jgi:hypothetical protein
MLPPLIRCPQRDAAARSKERGFTLALVTVSLVAIIAMAALSIDIGTLYQAKAEAQRAADAAALTAARVISISGITGDPVNGASDTSWASTCGGTSSPATLAAINVAQQNSIGGNPPSLVTVYYGAGSAGTFTTNCTAAGPNFGVNPVVKVTAQRTNLPIFFSRVFSLFGSNFAGTSVSATASAEVYNPSGSGLLASGMIPVEPRCVKPLIVANNDPGNGGLLVNPDGTIGSTGIYQLGSGVIGETFTIRADCVPSAANCNPPASAAGGNMIDNPPTAPTTTLLDYIPALVTSNASAVPACSNATVFQQAIGGCDQTTVYSCGVSSVASATQADLTINPGGGSGGSGDTATATQCLSHSTSGGQDTLAGGITPAFPFQIQAGASSPLKNVGVNTGDTITSSSSIVTLPIGYFGSTVFTAGQNQPFVTIGGFLQVFVQSIDPATGNMVVTVLNISGCGNAVPNGSTYVTGTSPVPVRLITTP